MRQLIRNGKIYDGTGSEPFTGDILIDQDRIAGIGEQIRKAVPDQEKSFGIEKVMINGQLVLSNGHLDEDALKTTGRAIPVAGT